MNELFNSEMSAIERLAILEDHADKIEVDDYYQALTAEDIADRKDMFFANASQLNKLQSELKDLCESLKGKIKPIEKDQKRLLSEIRTGQVEIHGKLYHIANYTTNMMEVYNGSGEFHASRRLRPDERQTSVFNLSQAK